MRSAKGHGYTIGTGRNKEKIVIWVAHLELALRNILTFAEFALKWCFILLCLEYNYDYNCILIIIITAYQQPGLQSWASLLGETRHHAS